MTEYRICEISGAQVPVSGDIRVLAQIASPLGVKPCPHDFHGNCDKPDICYAVKACASELEAKASRPVAPAYESELDTLRRGVAKMRWAV